MIALCDLGRLRPVGISKVMSDSVVQGSHTALVLLEHGYKVTAIDNLDNAFPVVLDRLKKLAGDKASQLDFIKVSFIIDATRMCFVLQFYFAWLFCNLSI